MPRSSSSRDNGSTKALPSATDSLNVHNVLPWFLEKCAQPACGSLHAIIPITMVKCKLAMHDSAELPRCTCEAARPARSAANQSGQGMSRVAMTMLTNTRAAQRTKLKYRPSGPQAKSLQISCPTKHPKRSVHMLMVIVA